MFIRNGEKLGSVIVDVDPGEAEKRLKRSAAAKKAVAARSESKIDPGNPDSVPAAIDSPGVYHPAPPGADPKPVEPEEDEEVEESEVPHASDKKEVWVDFAVSQGLDREEAESFTKQDLVDEYGG